MIERVKAAVRVLVRGVTFPVSPGCMWVECACGDMREIPADPNGRGPQWCRSCGAQVA